MLLRLLRVDLADAEATAAAVRQADPDLVLHLAAESHVDRSIEGPGAYGSTSSPDCVYIESNVSGTFHLLQAVRIHWEQLPTERQQRFRFHHISTDEVFGSLGETGRFSEITPYDPRSPYSASKAASDHLVNAWHHTDGLPAGAPHSQLITPVADRPGHDRRYAIDPTCISTELGWQPRHSYEEGLAATVAWYLEQQAWCRRVREQRGTSGGRLGVLASNPSSN